MAFLKDFFHLTCFQFGVSKDPSFIPSQRNSRAEHSATAIIETAPSHQAREPGSHEDRPNNRNKNQRFEPDMQVKSHNTKQNRSPAAEQTKASFETDDCEMIEILPNDKSNELAKRKRKSNENPGAQKAKASKQDNKERAQDADEHSPFMIKPSTANKSPFQICSDSVSTSTAKTSDPGVETGENRLASAQHKGFNIFYYFRVFTAS